MNKEFYFTCNSLVLYPSSINLFTDFPEHLYNKSTREFRFSKYGRFFLFKCSELCARYLYSYITQVAEAKDYGTLNTLFKANGKGIEVAYLSNENMGSKEVVKTIKEDTISIPGLEVTSKGLRILYAMTDSRRRKRRNNPQMLVNGFCDYKAGRSLEDGTKIRLNVAKVSSANFPKIVQFVNGLNLEQFLAFKHIYDKSNKYIYFSKDFSLVSNEKLMNKNLKTPKVLVKEVPIEVIKEVPVEVVKEVVKEVQVLKEVETSDSSEIELLELELELATKEKELAEKRLKLAQLKRGL
jgi:hypothetical protein